MSDFWKESFPIETSSTLKSNRLSERDDCGYDRHRSKSDLGCFDVSMFSTTMSQVSVKRVNEIKPKTKPNLLTPSMTRKRIQSFAFGQTEPKKQIGQPQYFQKVKRQSMQYATIKPFFNWKKFTPFCGFETKTGADGCLCGNPCPLLKQWTKNYKESDIKLYQQFLNQKVVKEHQIQIFKDIYRTYSECLTFSENTRYQEMLSEVLTSFSIYDPQIGYVQGMNLIAGVIIYHLKNSELSFWAFVDLMDQQQLRMIYLPDFHILNQHIDKILQIMSLKVYDLVEKMNELDIIPQSFLNGWILSLMATCIPLEFMHQVIDKFRKNGWNYIYQLIITYMLFMKQELMRAEDQADFLMSLSTKNSRQYGVIWEQMIESAVKFPLFQKQIKSSKFR